MAAEWWAFEHPKSGRVIAVVEVARASGITLTDIRDPRTATSYGTGALIADAFGAGVDEVWVGAGGSAMVDGGAGALQALGVQINDAEGRAIAPGGEGLCQIAEISMPELPGPMKVLCDVQNPWLGALGAPTVFGPQKGAGPEEVQLLEAGLSHLGEALAEATGRDPRHLARAGAAGGFAGGLWAAFGAELYSGLECVAELTELDAAIQRADLVITGEGQVDAQTAMGKVAAGVVARAEAHGRPTWIVGGAVTAQAEAWAADHPVALIPIPDGPISLEACMQTADLHLRRAVARAARLWSLAGGVQ